MSITEVLDPEWADPIIGNFITHLYVNYGISIESSDIRYRGFGSQGDGASFDFVMNGSDVLHFCKVNELTQFEKLILCIVMEKVNIKFYTVKNDYRINYVHEKTLETSYNFSINDAAYTDDLWNTLEPMVTELWKLIENIRLEQSRKLYKDLEDHYNELISLLETEESEKILEKSKWRLPTMCEFVQVIDYQVHGINGRHNGTVISEIQGWANYWTDQPIVKIGVIEYAWVFSTVEGISIKRVPINRDDIPIFLICVKTLPDGELVWQQEDNIDHPLSYLGVQSYLAQLNGE